MSRAKKQTAPSAPPRQLTPNKDTPRAAVEAAAAMIATHGITNTIRALDLAMLEATTPTSQAADVSEGVRLTSMRRRATQ